MNSLITDAAFWAAAIPAAILIGLSKSGVASGIAALAVPIMALSVPVPQAAAICLPLLAASDVMGVSKLFRHASWPLLKLLLPAGLAGIVLGALTLRFLSLPWVTFLVGVITLVFWVIRVMGASPASNSGHDSTSYLATAPRKPFGAAMGLLTGYTSFLAHVGTPPVHFYALPLQLRPVVFSATMSVLFTALNASKWVPYATLGLIDLRNMLTSAVLLPVALGAVWLGLKLLGRVSPTVFRRVLLTGMFLVGCKLLWDGLRGLGVLGIPA